jgi:DNA polymerase-4
VPLVVGGDPDGRGVVSTANYAAREYGIHSAMPAAQAKRLCPQAVFLRPDIERYRRESQRIMAIFGELTDVVEPASLDEAYLDLTGRVRSATRAAEHLRERVRTETGLTVSIGVSNSRLVAKIASDWNKPDGCTVVPPEQVLDFLAPLPVRRLHGVGPATEQVLAGLGVTTVAELRALDRARLGELLGRFGLALHDYAHGVDDRPVGVPRERKSLGAEDTFPDDLRERGAMEAEIARLAGHVAEQLAARGLAGRTVTLKVRYPDFRTVTRSHTTERPRSKAEELTARAVALLGRTEADARGARLLGVTVSALEEDGGGPEQLGLFG